MVRIQIIDDDFWCAEAIKAMVMDIDPTIVFEYSEEPSPVHGCDIYIIDNEFGNKDHAESIVREVRKNNPEAMIMVCSGTMDRVRYKNVINAGCDVAVEKGNAADRETMMVAIGRYVLANRSSTRKVSLVHVMKDICSIISNWNTRLESIDETESTHAEVA
jgi:DNA-binding NarL/FixJ family response regulator